MITKDETDQYRQDQMDEVYSVQNRLAQDGCPSNLKVIQKALLLPEELIRRPGDYHFPNPVMTLMKSPWPKKEKKKKKKGKK